MVFPTHPILRGWSPPAQDDHDLEVHVSYLSPAHLLASTSCIASHLTAASSDRRAQRNRSRDPSWIPRPRNAFIIFRCEYSREHSQAVPDGDVEESDVANPTAKTLSKRAAEAWKDLSPSGKDRYKILADKEREEHARLYPHYRFRPMRRQSSGLKKRERDLSIRRSSSSRSTSSEQVAFSAAEVDDAPQREGGLTYTPPSLAAIAPWDGDPCSPCMLGPVPSSHHDMFPTPFEGVDMECAQALEAYAIGLHNLDLFTNAPHPYSLALPEYHDAEPTMAMDGVPCNIEYSALFQEQGMGSWDHFPQSSSKELKT